MDLLPVSEFCMLLEAIDYLRVCNHQQSMQAGLKYISKALVYSPAHYRLPVRISNLPAAPSTLRGALLIYRWLLFRFLCQQLGRPASGAEGAVGSKFGVALAA